LAPTPLTRQLAARIVDYIRDEQAPAGTRLVERTLAEHLRVSRSPVRRALRLLQDDGVVGVAEKGGYTVLRAADELPPAPIDEDADVVERLYLRLAADRLDGTLPDRVTENGLARAYDLTPAQLARILRRVNAEGWIERLPGYGWEFQPMLTSSQAYEDSYRFRLVIEPAAILEPTFELDRKAVEEVRARAGARRRRDLDSPQRRVVRPQQGLPRGDHDLQPHLLHRLFAAHRPAPPPHRVPALSFPRPRHHPLP
jgi:DNA-binding GntR family transcriptional regulator